MADQDIQDQTPKQDEVKSDTQENKKEQETNNNSEVTSEKTTQDQTSLDDDSNSVETGEDSSEDESNADNTEDTSFTPPDSSEENQIDQDDPQAVAQQLVEAEEAEKALGISTSLESIADYMDRNPRDSSLKSFVIYSSIRATLAGSRTTAVKVFPALEAYEQEGNFTLTANEIRQRAQRVRQQYQGKNNA